MVIHRKIALICATCLGLFSPFPVLAMTLGEAYRAALENDPYFRAAYYANQAGSEEANVGRSHLLPEVTFVARTADNRGDRETAGRFGLVKDRLNYTSSSTGVYLRQPLVNFEKYAAYRQGVLQAEMSDKVFLSSRQELATRIVSAYLEAMVLKVGLELAEAELRATEAQCKHAERMFAGGEATLTDVDAAKKRLKLAEIQHLELVGRLGDAKRALGELTQSEDVHISSFRRAPKLKEEVKLSLEQVIEFAVSNNPSVLEKDVATDVAEQNINRAKFGYLPTLDLTANYSKTNQDSVITLGQKLNTQAVGLEMQWSLLNGGQTSALTRKAQSQLLQAKQEAQIARTKIRIEARAQYHAVQATLLKIQALDDAIDAGERNLQAMLMGVRLGIRTTVDVANAKKDLAQNRYEHADAMRNHIIAVLKLSAAMGELKEDKVAWAEQFTVSGIEFNQSVQ